MVHTARRTIGTSQLRVDKMVGGRCPYLQVVRVPQVPSWRRQLCSHSCTCSVTRYVQAPSCGEDFSGLCTQVQGQGSCPQGHGSHNQVLCDVIWTNTSH